MADEYHKTNMSYHSTNQSWLVPEDGYENIMNIAYIINKWYLWVIFAFGFPGNTAAIFTIFRMRHMGSFGFYVVLLAVVDSLALIVKIIHYQLLLAEWVNVSAASCKFVSFMAGLANFLITYANWILVLMAVSRLLAVKFPLKIQSFNYKNSVISALVAGVVLASPFLPLLWIVSFNNQTGCQIDKTSIALLTFLYWTHRCLYGFIPFVILLASNILIARVIRNHFRIRNALRQVTRIHRVSFSTIPDTIIQRQIFFMLFTTTSVFVLLTFPRCAYSVANFYWTPEVGTKKDAIKYLLKQLVFVLCDANHAVNFYLYFLSGRRFRVIFMRSSLFRCEQRRAANLSQGRR